MINGVFKSGERVITRDGEGALNKKQGEKEGRIEVKLNTGEVKTYAAEDVSDDADAG